MDWLSFFQEIGLIINLSFSFLGTLVEVLCELSKFKTLGALFFSG